MPGETQVAKMRIQEADDLLSGVTCSYNPESIRVTQTAQWSTPSGNGRRGQQTPQFTGTSARQVDVTLLLEGWGDTDDISKDIDKLYKWTLAPEHDTSPSPTPPVVRVIWGEATVSLFDFRAYVKTVVVEYKMFSGVGKPLRANVTLTLTETPADTAGQNPTSGGVRGRNEHHVVAGETLQSIAYREYKRADYWRALARANGVDDPLRVPPGRTLLIPPATEAARLMELVDA